MAKKTKALTVKAGTKLVVDTNPDFLYKIKLLDGKEIVVDFNHVAKKKFNDLLLELEKDTKIVFKDFFKFEDANIVLPSPDGAFYLNANTFIDETGTLHEYETGETLTELEGGIQAGKTVAETVAATGGFMSYIPLVGIAGGLSAWGGSNPTTTDTNSGVTAENSPPPPDTSIYTNRIVGTDGDDRRTIKYDANGNMVFDANGQIMLDNEWTYGTDDNDNMDGLGGNDSLRGGKGDDWLKGGDGDDVLWGSSDNDYLYGNNGKDTLNGGRGDDVLYGGNGDDELWGNDYYITHQILDMTSYMVVRVMTP